MLQNKIIKISLIVLAVLAVAAAGYAVWYSQMRQTKITEAEQCRYDMENPRTSPELGGIAVLRICSTLVPPTFWNLTRGRIVVEGLAERMELAPYSLKDVLLGNYFATLNLQRLNRCDQSATTTDCSKLPPQETKSPAELARNYTEIASTKQSGKVDEHLFIDNELIEVEMCGRKLKTRQILIDGADVVIRFAKLLETGERICHSGFIWPEDGIFRTGDVTTYRNDHPDFSELTYILNLNGYQVYVDPNTGLMRFIDGFDGSIDTTHELWQTYANQELGISFKYPRNKDSSGDGWKVWPEKTGSSFSGRVDLPEAVIYISARTGDFSSDVGKGGLNIFHEGYVVKNGQYHILNRGNISEVPFMPDEKWQLSDGSEALVLYKKDYGLNLDYPEPPARVLVNIPGGQFSGIGFSIQGEPNWEFASATDKAILKKIVTSIKFL